MGWTPTVSIFAAAVVCALFSGWRGSRPPDFKRGPRLAPWRLIMLTSGAAAMLMLAHMGTLAGVAHAPN